MEKKLNEALLQVILPNSVTVNAFYRNYKGQTPGLTFLTKQSDLYVYKQETWRKWRYWSRSVNVTYKYWQWVKVLCHRVMASLLEWELSVALTGNMKTEDAGNDKDQESNGDNYMTGGSRGAWIMEAEIS
jgi:hypothetical protein